jgi:hypothetical protein
MIQILVNDSIFSMCRQAMKDILIQHVAKKTVKRHCCVRMGATCDHDVSEIRKQVMVSLHMMSEMMSFHIFSHDIAVKC